jgi:hypothetical protein
MRRIAPDQISGECQCYRGGGASALDEEFRSVDGRRAEATGSAALSGSQTKAPGFAEDYLISSARAQPWIICHSDLQRDDVRRAASASPSGGMVS